MAFNIMTTFLTYLGRLIVITLGFTLAFLMALFVVSLPVWVQPDAGETVFFVTAFAMGMIFLAVHLGSTAGFIILALILVSEYRGWRDWLTYALSGGAVTGGTMLVISGGREISDIALITAAGLAGGITYWAVAGRNAGKMFERILAERRQ
jgi:hypothetical protein